MSADMNCALDCRRGFLMNWSLEESSASHCMETSHWLLVYLIVYIYLYSSHNKYTMAFKIKSAKIFFFFWNKRTHSDVVVCSSSMFEHTLGCYRTSTGRGNEALAHPVPAGQHRLRTKVTQGGMAVSHSLEEKARQQSVRPGGQHNSLHPQPS